MDLISDILLMIHKKTGEDCGWNLPDYAIEIVRAGIEEHNAKAKLSGDYSGSSNRVVYDELGDAGIDIVKLDDYFAGQKVTFIKADSLF